MNLQKFLLFISLFFKASLSYSQGNKYDIGMQAGVGMVNLRGAESFNEEQ